MEATDNSYDIFEHSKMLYAHHRAAKQLKFISNTDVKAKLAFNWLCNKIEEHIREITSLGGKVATGTDVFGDSGPIAKYQNNEPIPYEIGTIESEKFLSTYREIFG